MSGFLLINKPSGPTSHDIIDRIRCITDVKTVGHAGTLDPFASGLLIVGVGREATREFSKLVGLDKRYHAALKLGAVSDTDDRTGMISAPLFKKEGGVKIPTEFSISDIKSALKKFTGELMQIPPMYSAKKIHGKKMYELAREGKIVERKPVEIKIFSIVPITNDQRSTTGNLVLDVHCSSGTYIRALARDIGETLHCGAYLEELKRTAVGPFNLSEAVKTDDLSKDSWEKYLLPVENVLKKITEYKPSFI
jgi:tRNA pseudouridine55 synthase